RGHEGRSYDVVRLLEAALEADAGGGSGGVEYSMEKSHGIKVVRELVKELDPALAENLEKNFEPLGHVSHEVRVARRGGESGDSALGRSEAFPFVSLWRMKQPEEGVFAIHQLWLNGSVEFLDEQGAPLDITDPLPENFTTKPVAVEV